jgi:alpha-tubulin suppressor-like RCC1 family protein
MSINDLKDFTSKNNKTMKKFIFFLILIANIQANAQCWSKISAGDYHTLAISIDGKLWAWGANYEGELGDGTTTNRTTPAFISSSSWLDVSAGLSHSLGLKNDGTLWAWGRNGTGQLGTGTGRDTSSQVQIGTGSNWAKIAAGANHSAAIKSDGTLWTWGSDEYGQLGNGGTNTPLLSPIKADSSVNWKNVYASEYNTYAIKQDGTLWGCGRNNVGQVGDGTNVNKGAFVQIGTAVIWSEISSGRYFAVGLQTDGSIWAWGDNFYGQLGDGTNIGKTVPVKIGTTSDWKVIACGAEHIVAQKTDGTVYAWGNGQDGALGINNDAYFNTPKKVNITNVQSISCGSLHSLAIKNDNKLWAWGNNVNNQFGNGTNTSTLIPVEVACPTTTAIRFQEAANNFKIFPNPVSDILTIRNPTGVSFEKVVITDLTGKKVREQTGNQSMIDVSQLPTGMYLLQIISEGKKSVTKFIKQ